MSKTRQCSILLIEDDPLLAMDVEMVLKAAGYRVIGPVATSADAIAVLHDESPDMTILDLNLGTEMVFPVFDCLARIGIPFIILSGHSQRMVPARHADRPFLQKPYEAKALLRVIQNTLESDGNGCARIAS